MPNERNLKSPALKEFKDPYVCGYEKVSVDAILQMFSNPLITAHSSKVDLLELICMKNHNKLLLLDGICVFVYDAFDNKIYYRRGFNGMKGHILPFTVSYTISAEKYAVVDVSWSHTRFSAIALVPEEFDKKANYHLLVNRFEETENG